ncbi:MAG: phosphoglycerate kinase [Oscillospiraceae bacterium]
MMATKKTVKDIKVKGRTVLVRCDFNVPLKDGVITDDKRIKASLETIEYLIENGAKIVLMSHLGRPKGEFKEEFSLKPVAERLSKYLNKTVQLSKDVAGEDSIEKAKALKEGDILLIENVRFVVGETKNDSVFSKQLASLGDIFVNDAFGTAHRAHSSTVGISEYLTSVAGFLIEKELKFLGEAINKPERPFVAILGGSKVSDKIGVIESLIEKVDVILIGGAMAYTFLRAQGFEIGNSLVEADKLNLASNLISKAKEKNVEFILPLDSVAGESFAENCENYNTDDKNIKQGYMGLDIGTKTVELFDGYIKNAKTVILNGPMGVFEWSNFANGTKGVIKSLADSNCISIVGGGDSAAAAEIMGFADKMTHVSTGGGASLEFLEGKILPGVDCLSDK